MSIPRRIHEIYKQYEDRIRILKSERDAKILALREAEASEFEEMMKNGDVVFLDRLGYPYHFATRDGRILSRRARGSNQHKRILSAPREVIGGKGSHGYRTIQLRNEIDGKKRSLCIHVLIARAFLGDPPEWHEEYRHLDSNKMNCSVSNLSFGTRKQNAADRIAADTLYHPPIKISPESVESIRIRLSNGERGCDLAREFAVAPSLISSIKNGKGRFSRREKNNL